MNLTEYLRRIGFDATARADLATLRELQRAHVHTVPFENIDVQLRRPVTLNTEEIYAKVVEGRRGGWCYELNGLMGWALGEIGFDVMRVSAGVMRESLERGERPLDVRLSEEYGARIIHSIVTGQPRVIYGNVPNDGLIDGLPEGCCVEVPCLVDANGVQPTRVGEIPPQLTALMRTNVNVQELTVEAAITGRREHVYHAAMLDPHTAAELDMEQIRSLVDDLLAAHGALIPEALRLAAQQRVA